MQIGARCKTAGSDVCGGVIMKEHGGSAVDAGRFPLPVQAVPGIVPGGHADAGILRHGKARCERREGFKIFLIAHLAVFTAVIAPLVAAFPPPVQNPEAFPVVAEAHQPHVIQAVDRKGRIAGGEIMTVNKHGLSFHFIKHGFGGGKEEHVRIHIGEALPFFHVFQKTQQHSGGQRPVVLDPRSVGPGRRQSLVARFQHGEANRNQPRNVKPGKQAERIVIKTYHPDGTARITGEQGADHGDPLDQVIYVEIGGIGVGHD